MSVVAQSLFTSYAYGPYGETTSAGAASSNATQYTGRENDGDGLYFYRARYYSPKYGRFLSQDPAGLAGGINPYAYVNNSPLTATDPTGETPALLGACAGGAAWGAGYDVVSRALSGRKFNAGHALGAAVGGCATGMATMGLARFMPKMSPGANPYAMSMAKNKRSVTKTIVVKTSRAARREAMRQMGIPNTADVLEYGKNDSGHFYLYKVNDEYLGVHNSTMDRGHEETPHWEAGPIKKDGDILLRNVYGRHVIENGPKVRVEYGG